jgi:hypothetical protein
VAEGTLATLATFSGPTPYEKKIRHVVTVSACVTIDARMLLACRNAGRRNQSARGGTIAVVL